MTKTTAKGRLRAVGLALLPSVLLGTLATLFVTPLMKGGFSTMVLFFFAGFVGPLWGIDWSHYASWSQSFAIGIWVVCSLCLVLIIPVLIKPSRSTTILAGLGFVLWYTSGAVFLLAGA